MADATNTTSQDVTLSASISDDQLKAITSFADALKFATAEVAAKGGVIESINDYGTGFAVLPTAQKDKLLGVPLLILEWFHREGDYVSEDANGERVGFVSAVVVDENDRRFIVNDGSTGIAKQLREVTADRREKGHPYPTAFLAAPGGLSKSEYLRNKNSGEIARRVPEGAKASDWEPGTTYYLA